MVLAALVVFGFLLFKGWDKIVNDEIDGMVTITGNFSCLPVKAGVEVPETCTLGVRRRRVRHSNAPPAARPPVAGLRGRSEPL